MVNYNPSFPEVLGNEWLPTHGGGGRVWAGAPGLMARIPSTAAETITALRLSATVNPLLEASIPTVVDVIEEGSELPAAFSKVSLIPNSDVAINGWRTQAGGATNLFQAIDEDTSQWPGPAMDTWIQTFNVADEYEASVNATQFAAAQPQANARIGFVAIQAILGANTGFRKLRVSLKISGTRYAPAGGTLRDVHGYGAIYAFWWGELNPSTGKPWTPANIADFGSAGASRLHVLSQAASADHYPRVYAMRLVVYYVTVDNRVAVGVWRRPEELTSRLTDVVTDSLITVPSGAANWSKLSARNYLMYWRQSISPAAYGAVVADDVRWNTARQLLPANAQPPGANPPNGATALGSALIAYDQFGRPTKAFAADPNDPVPGLVMVRSDLAHSTDSHPYRLDIADLAAVRSTQSLGQRVVPGSSQSYLGVRVPIIPPAAPANPTLTVEVRRVSDNLLMGGTFTITAEAARALPNINGWRYVSGFLASGASLVGGTAYEIRLTSTAGGDWTMAMPDAGLGPTASFGGTTSGAFIGAAHQTGRDLAVTIVRQPNPVTSPTATLLDDPVTTFSEVATTIKHVTVAWVAPVSGMGGTFARYEVERQIGSGAFQRIADITNIATLTFVDREAPRGVASTYRIRCVGTDGRFSGYATTSSATPVDATARPMLILSSNHTSAQFVHLYEITDAGDGETSYPILSTERQETVAIHGADYQVVFQEAEDRGVGWRTQVALKQNVVAAKGIARFAALLALVTSLDVPYLCAMDHQGNRILGHVAVAEGLQAQPDSRYRARFDITPTHTEPVPATV